MSPSWSVSPRGDEESAAMEVRTAGVDNENGSFWAFGNISIDILPVEEAGEVNWTLRTPSWP